MKIGGPESCANKYFLVSYGLKGIILMSLRVQDFAYDIDEMRD